MNLSPLRFPNGFPAWLIRGHGPSLLSGLLLLGTGCRSLDSGGIQDFAAGLTAAKTQTKTTFATVAKLTREDSIDFAAAQPTLKAVNLVSVPSPEAMEAWEAVFGTLERYGQHLSALSGKELTAGLEASLGSLAQRFNETGVKLKADGWLTASPQVSASLATGFSEAARLLVRARTEKRVRQVLHDTDPAMAQIFSGLADALGATSKEGLRQLVAAHAHQNQGEKQAAFLGASPTERRRLTVAFAEILATEETQDAALASLRRSLLALSEAHHALALGQPASVRALVEIVATELKHVRELQSGLKSKLN